MDTVFFRTNWWDEAMWAARVRAQITGQRQRVRAAELVGWVVEESPNQLISEPCS